MDEEGEQEGEGEEEERLVRRMKEARTISQYSDPFHQGEESSRGGDSGQWREAKTNSDRADRASNIGPACQPHNATIGVKMIAILVHNTGMVGKKEENSMHKHMELFQPNVEPRFVLGAENFFKDASSDSDQI